MTERTGSAGAPMRRVFEYPSALQSQTSADWTGFRAELIKRATDGPSQVRMIPNHHMVILSRRLTNVRAVIRFDDDRHRNVVAGSGFLQLVAAGSELQTEVMSAVQTSYAALFIDPAAAATAAEAAKTALITRSAYLDEAAPIRTTVEAIAQEVEQSAPFGRLYLDGLSAILLAQIGRHLHPTQTALPSARGGLAPHHLRRVTDYLADHLAEEVTLAELSGLAGLSAHHFCRAFKQSTGTPPHRWQMQLRVVRAQELMRATPLSLAQIAAACGFSDQSHFTTVFRKSIGVTPSVWRRACRA